MQKLKVLDLFSGIGGFSLGLERTGGFETVAFCEIDPFCQKVLAKHWPGVPIYDDIRELTESRLSADGIAVDVITGGFPCQDISLAGRRQGLSGERSGLWSELRRLAGDLLPKYVFVENTPGLLSLGLDTVLADLATLGFDAEWHCIPAAYVGADHIRDRIWIIGYPSERKPKFEWWPAEPQEEVGKDASDTVCTGLPRWGDTGADRTDAGELSKRVGSALSTAPAFPREHCKHQPVLGRGIHGIPHRVDRIRALGTAVVPQIPELIGRAILNSMEDT